MAELTPSSSEFINHETEQLFKLQTLEVGGLITGKISCSVPFVAPDGRQFIAISGDGGLWIGPHKDLTSLKQVFGLMMVAQCAVFEERGIFVVLAEQSLFAYSINSFLSSAEGTPMTLQKLNESEDVKWFRVGTIERVALVIFAFSKSSDTVLRNLELDANAVDNHRNLSVQANLDQANSRWFKAREDFSPASECYDMHFMKTRIVFLCAHGFEMKHLNQTVTLVVPPVDDPNYANIAPRLKISKLMAIFPCDIGEFFLCYEEFGIFMDKRLVLLRSTIEWEGKINYIAWHAPYVFLFSSTSIEVRDVSSGHLCQTILGNGLKCLWDGRTSDMWLREHESRVQGIMERENEKRDLFELAMS